MVKVSGLGQERSSGAFFNPALLLWRHTIAVIQQLKWTIKIREEVDQKNPCIARVLIYIYNVLLLKQVN